MFFIVSELYNKVLGSLPPELRRALLFGLGVFFMLAAFFGGNVSNLATKIAS
jgi:hypothetical protein